MDEPLLKTDSVHDEDSAAAGPSTLSAPAYEQQQSSKAGRVRAHKSDPFIPPGGEEPPPDFTPYDAEYFKGSHGEIISHDAHLNEDGGLRQRLAFLPLLR